MAENPTQDEGSALSKKLINVIKKSDKLFRDLQKNTAEMIDTIQEVWVLFKDEPKDQDKP
jgi:hypothetical protein